MRKWAVTFLFIGFWGYSQTWEIKTHPNNRKMAIVKDGQQISSYRFSEVSELSEGLSYVAEGDLYGYLSSHGRLLTPFRFAVASNFKNGFALVGDSVHQNILTRQMKLILPDIYVRVRSPKFGLILVQSHEGLWGAYDVNGSLKLPVIYSLPPYLVDKNRIIIKLADEYGLVDSDNNVLFNPSYQYISPKGYGYKSGTYLRLF